MTRVRLLGLLEQQHNTDGSEEDNTKQQSIESSGLESQAGSDGRRQTNTRAASEEGDGNSTTTSTTIGGSNRQNHLPRKITYEMDGNITSVLHNPHLQQQQQQARLSPAYQTTILEQQQQPYHPSPSSFHQPQQFHLQQQYHPLQHQQVQYLSPILRPSTTATTTFIDGGPTGILRTVSPVPVASGSGMPVLGGTPISFLTTYTQSPSHVSLQPTTGLTQGTTGIPTSQTYSAIVYQPISGAGGQPPPQPVLVVGDPSIPMSIPSLFNDRQIKMDFLRKVLGLLFTMIGFSFLIINVFNFTTIKEWVQLNAWFLIVTLISSILIMVLLTFLADTGQDCPANVCLTWMFTLSASLTIGASSCFNVFESLQLIYFFNITLILIFALIFSLIVCAFQTNYDFNMRNCISYVIMIVVVFVVIYLVLIIVWGYWLAMFLPTVLFAATGGLAYTLYVIYDIICMIQRCYLNGLTPSSVMLGVIYLHTDFFNCYGNFWQSC